MSKNFKQNEFACKCCHKIIVSSELLAVLELVRSHFNRPVSINSGYRCDAHNKEIGGKPNSRHKLGVAADITVIGITPAQVAYYLESIFPDTYGVGRYNSFTHIDVRKKKARW